MPLSDHEKTVLREIEVAFRSDTSHSGIARTSVDRRTGHRLAATIGLLVAGIVATAVGLRLQDNLGTALGVVGFVFIVDSASSATRLLGPLPGWVAAHRRNPSDRP